MHNTTSSLKMDPFKSPLTINRSNGLNNLSFSVFFLISLPFVLSVNRNIVSDKHNSVLISVPFDGLVPFSESSEL